MIVRPARQADIPALVDYGRQVHAETRWGVFPYDPARAEHNARAMASRRDRAVYLAADSGVCGVLLGTLSRLIHVSAVCAVDVLFHAERGGDELLDAFRQWARDVGADAVVIGDSNGGRGRAKDRFFSRHGLSRAGGVYVERLT